MPPLLSVLCMAAVRTVHHCRKGSEPVPATTCTFGALQPCYRCYTWLRQDRTFFLPGQPTTPGDAIQVCREHSTCLLQGHQHRPCYWRGAAMLLVLYMPATRTLYACRRSNAPLPPRRKCHTSLHTCFPRDYDGTTAVLLMVWRLAWLPICPLTRRLRAARLSSIPSELPGSLVLQLRAPARPCTHNGRVGAETAEQGAEPGRKSGKVACMDDGAIVR